MKKAFCALILLLVSSPLVCLVNVVKNQAVVNAIGQQIWHNECGKSVEKLTSWNTGEEFASLGIGHFIWYPPHQKKNFKETFPDLLTFLADHNYRVPRWLIKHKKVGCPWKNQSEFLAAQDSKQMADLRKVLHETIELQTKFIIQRLVKMYHTVHSDKKKNHIRKQIERLSHHPRGIFALIDYLHFKGEGTSVHERYKGHGWGLQHVLCAMKGSSKGEKAIQEFCECAKHTLTQRVKNAPPERHEERWLKGWINRIDTYTTIELTAA